MSTMKDALRLAASDPAFARGFVASPETFRAKYNLTDAQIEQVKRFAAIPQEHLNENNPALFEEGYEGGTQTPEMPISN